MNKLIIFQDIKKKEQWSEEKLIKKSIKGDSQCFELLVIKYTSYLYKIAYGYSKNEQDALDLIQECTYRAWLNIKQLKKDASFKFWISRLLVNIAIDSYRKESKISKIDNEVELEVNDIFIEEKIDLNEAINLLRPEYKTVILLKYFEDITIPDISYIMDIPQNTVKTYIKRAKESIKGILKEDYLYER